VGVEWGGILIFTHQLGEKAEILRTEAPVRVGNEEGKGRKESKMGDGEAVMRRTSRQKKKGARSRRWEMERQ
jgi:hypothetical protein